MKKISRRDLLKGGLGVAFTAGATSLAYKNTEYLPTLHEDDWTAEFLLEKYNMTDIETAQRLRDHIIEETTNYQTFGVFSGLAHRTYNSVRTPDEAKGVGYSFQNIFTVPILNFLMGDRAIEEAEIFQNKSLVNPNTLINNYGMTNNNARAFCYDYKDHAAKTIHFSSSSWPFIIELFRGFGPNSSTDKELSNKHETPKP